jgi:hypothetical protein
MKYEAKMKMTLVTTKEELQEGYHLVSDDIYKAVALVLLDNKIFPMDFCKKSPNGRHSFYQDTDGFSVVFNCVYCGKRK